MTAPSWEECLAAVTSALGTPSSRHQTLRSPYGGPDGRGLHPGASWRHPSGALVLLAGGAPCEVHVARAGGDCAVTRITHDARRTVAEALARIPAGSAAPRADHRWYDSGVDYLYDSGNAEIARCERCGVERHRNAAGTGWVYRFKMDRALHRVLVLGGDDGLPCSPLAGVCVVSGEDGGA